MYCDIRKSLLHNSLFVHRHKFQKHANLWLSHRELEQMEPRLNFEVPAEGLELVISLLTTKLSDILNH